MSPAEVKEEGKKRFDRELTKVEVRLIETTASGSEADFRAGDEAAVDAEKAKSWGADRKVGADFLAWLCTSPKAAAMVTHKGVRVRGVRVEGVLDLAMAKVPFPLAIVASYIPDVVDCSGAELDSLEFDGSSIGVINGRSARVMVDVRLRNLPAASKLDLSNGRIGGDLDLSGSRFANKVEETVYADYLSVGRDFVMTNGFTSEGSVRLAGASIRGDINCAGGSFLRPDGVALNASGIDVKGNAYLSRKSRVGGKSEPFEEFRVEGADRAVECADRRRPPLQRGPLLRREERGRLRHPGPRPERRRRRPPRLRLPVEGASRPDGRAGRGLGPLPVGKFAVNPNGGAAEGEKDGVTDRGLALDLGSAIVGHDVVMGGRLLGATGSSAWRGRRSPAGSTASAATSRAPRAGPRSRRAGCRPGGDVHLGGAAPRGRRRGRPTGPLRGPRGRPADECPDRGRPRLPPRELGGAGGSDPLVLEASGTSVEGNAYLCDDFRRRAGGPLQRENRR